MTAGRGTIMALLWKEWRQSWQMLVGALIALVALPLGLNALVTLYANALMVPGPWTPGIAALVLILASPLLAMILAARIFCRDFGADVETFLLAKPVKTSSIVAAKYLAGFGVLAAVIAIGAGLELLLAAVTGTLDQFGRADWSALLRIACGELPAVVLIFTATAAAGVWLRRTTSAALVGLLAAGLWYALPLMFRGLWGVNVLAAVESTFSKGGLWHMLPYLLGTLGAACAAVALSVRLARWPAQWQVKPKHLAIGAAAAILAMFLGITSQVGNNLRIVESRCSARGSLNEHPSYTNASPALVDGKIICTVGRTMLQFYEWTAQQKVLARGELLWDDYGHADVLQLVPGKNGQLWALTKYFYRQSSNRELATNILSLMRVDVSEPEKPRVVWQQELLKVTQRREWRVNADIAIKDDIGYLIITQWCHATRSLDRSDLRELRVIDLSEEGQGRLLSTHALTNTVSPKITLLDDRLIIGDLQGRIMSFFNNVVRFDISADATQPKRITEALPNLRDYSTWGGRACFDGRHVFLASHKGLRIYRLSDDELSWSLVGERTPAYLEMMLTRHHGPPQQEGNRLYVPTRGFGLIVYDISDLTRPRRIAHWNSGSEYEVRVVPLGDFIALPDYRTGRMLVAHRP